MKFVRHCSYCVVASVLIVTTMGTVPGSIGSNWNLRGCKDIEPEGKVICTNSTEYIGDYANLRSLHLVGNQLNGSDIEALCKLTGLRTLILERSKFTESFESLSKLTKLQYMYLNNNQLTGSVEALGKLTALVHLHLDDNKFTGSVEALGKLTKLTQLHLEGNQFTGSVQALGKLTNLTRLNLGDNNKLYGSVEALGNLSKLGYLNLRNNLFTGSVETLGKLTKLAYLNLDKNKCTGSVEALSKLNKLKYMFLAENQFTGSVEALGKLTELVNLNLDGNQFAGSVQALGKLSKLTRLNLRDNNKLNGSVEALGNLPELFYLQLRNNQFTGSVEALGKLTKLEKTLHLGVNQFTGNVQALGKLTKLKFLFLKNNKFTGNLEALGKLTELKRLRLEANDFVGSLNFLKKMTKLERLHIRNNNFTGNLSTFGFLDNLQVLTMDNSGKFEPPVPQNVYRLAPDDMHDLGFTCRWLPDYGGPSLDLGASSDTAACAPRDAAEYVSLDQTASLKCMHSNFPVLSNGTLFKAVLLAKDAVSCASRHLSVIPTKAECQAAVTMLQKRWGVNPTAVVQAMSVSLLPYCGRYHGSFVFDKKGVREKRGINNCRSDKSRCVCKQAPKEMNITCVYRGGKARWEPSIDKLKKFKCLGYGACRTNDASAIILKETSGADVRTCSNLQDGDLCDDFECNKSMIRNPQRNKIRCKYNVWSETDKDYCVFCPPGAHKFSNVECKKCSKGKYLLPGQQNDYENCLRCPYGTYQPETGQMNCIDCPRGTFQNETAQAACKPCPEGWYQTERGQSECTECKKGQKCPKADKNPRPCPAGNYQDETGQITCKPCALGKYQKYPFQTECEKCRAGQYQHREGRRKCVECEVGRYQRETGRSSCIACKWYSWCVKTSSEEPAISPFVFIIMLLLLASIPLIVKVVQLVIKALTAWKPQSKAEAALAKKFIVPKSADDILPSVSALKECQEHFVAHGWTSDDVSIIEEHAELVISYLGSRVQEAFNPKQIRIMRSCINMDVLHDFKTLYDATMKNVRSKELSGFNSLLLVAQKMDKKTECPRNPSELIKLYNSGRAVYNRFHAFLARAAKASDSAYVYKTQNRLSPGMKGLYRVLEKGVFKYNQDWTGDLDFGQVRDLVRGGIIDNTMEGLAAIANYMHESNEVTVCRVKNRFDEPSPAGWTDLMINFYLSDDPSRHVCEVQLMHFKMYSQRTTQEGHDAYNVYRAASELLVTTYLRTKQRSRKSKLDTRKQSTSKDSVELSPHAASMKLERLVTTYLRTKQRQREFRTIEKRESSVTYSPHVVSAIMKLAKSPNFNNKVLHYDESNQMVKTKPSSVVPAGLVCGPTSNIEKT